MFAMFPLRREDGIRSWCVRCTATQRGGGNGMWMEGILLRVYEVTI